MENLTPFYIPTCLFFKKQIALGVTHHGMKCRAFGYKEWLDALESGEYSISTIKKEIVRNSVKYAKRQMTFFNSFESVRWFDPRDVDSIRGYLGERGVALS